MNDEKHDGGFKLPTIEKYTNALRLAIEKTRNETFKGKEFIDKNKLPYEFVTACDRLNYIKQSGSRGNTTYTTSLKAEQVEPAMTRRLLKEISAVREEKRQNKKFKKVRRSMELTEIELDYLSDEQLFTELQKRGYEGKLTRNIEL